MISAISFCRFRMTACPFAISYSVNAIHALDGKAYKKHKDTIADFNKDYMRTEVFQRELGRRITGAETIKDNLNRAFKRVKANKDTPKSVRRVAIPKPNGGVRKLGIPTVIDRTVGI